MRNRLVLVAAGATMILAAGAGIAIAGTPAPAPSVPMMSTAPLNLPAAGPASWSPTTSPTTEAAAAPAGEITHDEAASIALAHVGGGRVGEIESGYEHGRHEWKAEILDGNGRHDVRVDTATGAITRVDVRGDRGGRDIRVRDDNPGADDRRGRDNRGADDNPSWDDHPGRDDHGGDDRGRGRGSDD